jgi:transcriptional regulator with XRE-family HTH domain
MQQTRMLPPEIEAVRHHMQEQRISKSELARRLGWGRMQVHRRLEADPEFSVSELREVAAVLGVPLSALISADDTPAEVTA